MDVATRKIEVAGITVTVREITVNEVRDWLVNADNEKNDIVGDSILDDISINEICRCSDLTAKQASRLKPSELIIIANGCKELNTSFFGLRARLKTVPANKAKNQL